MAESGEHNNFQSGGALPEFTPINEGEKGVERQEQGKFEKSLGVERISTPAKRQPSTQTPTSPLPPVVIDETAVNNTASTTTTPLDAKDVDRIEKQWVSKAKEVVLETKDDPYKRKNEISRVKVDYIKKRFNKSIPYEE